MHWFLIPITHDVLVYCVVCPTLCYIYSLKYSYVYSVPIIQLYQSSLYFDFSTFEKQRIIERY